ncbi:hypothetical protein KFL_002700240 [Klebsormidium nitens]|uniref:Ferritin n=1 Tax=Klebsormidium nitens TaxID=105231 RepID=A0A1Y1I582_KLENI|nr:hypothetical protein KFL_002700240 [Klebsormidium nitens]|eukprot:GAQ86105.1 hypothetical protein KFL_002700240 [Klebsormidium nitens]
MAEGAAMDGAAGREGRPAEEHEETHKGYQPIGEIRACGGLDKLVGPTAGARPASLARMHLDPALDKQLSAAVGVALGTWYNLEAMAVFCLKDTVALPGFTRYFRGRAGQEYREARSIMDYVSQRGGAVQFKEIAPPPNSFNHEEKGDALFLMEYALALEKVQNDKYVQLFRAAGGSGDPGVQAFVQVRLLGPRAAIIQRTAQCVAQLRRLGKGAGVFVFNAQLLAEQPREESLGNEAEDQDWSLPGSGACKRAKSGVAQG